MKKRLMVLLLLPLGWTACKKEDKGAPRKETLMKGQWKITEMKVNLVISQDLLAEADDCVKDNLYTFNENTDIGVDEGATKCDASDPQTGTDGNWSLTGNDSKLVVANSSITMGFGDITMDITQLDTKTMKLQKDTAVTYLGKSYNGKVNVTMTNVK